MITRSMGNISRGRSNSLDSRVLGDQNIRPIMSNSGSLSNTPVRTVPALSGIRLLSDTNTPVDSVDSRNSTVNPSSLNIRSMWDNHGFTVVDEVSSEVTDVNPPTGLNSRASSYLSLGEVDLLTIQERLDGFEKKFPDLSAAPKKSLDWLHDQLITVQGDFDQYVITHQGEDENLVKILTENIESLTKEVNKHRFGVLEKPRVQFKPPSVNQDKVVEELTEQVKNFISAAEPRIISESVLRVCDEYNRVSIKCVQSKADLKRGISGIRQDLNTIFGDISKHGTSISEIKTAIEVCNSSTKANASAANTNFENLNLRLSQLESNFSKSVERIAEFEKAFTSAGPLTSVTNLKESLKAIQSRLDTLEKSSVSVEPTLIKDISSESVNKGLAPPVSVSGDPSIGNNVPVDRTVGIPVPDGNLNSIIPEGNLIDLNQSSPSRSDVRSVASLPSEVKVSRIKRKVNLCISLADKITSRELTSCTKSQAIEFCTYDQKKLESLKSEIKAYESQLLDLPECDELILDHIEDSVKRILEWESSLDELCRRHYLHLSKEKTLLKNVELKKFTGDSDGDTVYHFMSVFSSLTDSCCDPKDKATLLFSSYLSDDIMKEVEPFKSDFSLMESYLFQRYGDVREIAQSKVHKIAELRHPPSNNSYQNIQYFKTVQNLLLHCESLVSCPDINREEVSSVIHNSSYVKQIVSFLPKSFIHKFVDALEREPKIPPPSGKKYFEILKDQVSSTWRRLDNVCNITNIREIAADNKKAPKSANVASNQQQNSGTQSPKPQNKGKSNQPKSKLYFPCPFHESSEAPHELGRCEEFFSKSNSERFTMCKTHKVCFTCLSPECYATSKSCISSVSSTFLCKECKADRYTRRCCVLTCYRQGHSRPSLKVLESDLFKLLRVFNPSLLTNVREEFNLVVLSNQVKRKNTNSSGPKTKSSAVDPKSPVLTFDTSSGSQVSKPDALKFSSREDSVYIFQTLKVKDSEILCFYDSGASGPLIKGELAEKLGLKVVDPRSQLIGALGNSSMYTEYGLYTTRLGPDQNGFYHELTLQGINQITSAYPKYDLSEIVREVEVW